MGMRALGNAMKPPPLHVLEEILVSEASNNTFRLCSEQLPTCILCVDKGGEGEHSLGFIDAVVLMICRPAALVLDPADAEGEMKCKLYCFQPSALVSSTCKQQLPERGCAKESSSSPLLVLFCLEELKNLVAFATLVTNGIGHFSEIIQHSKISCGRMGLGKQEETTQDSFLRLKCNFSFAQPNLIVTIRRRNLPEQSDLLLCP
ncbi:hypothetical protein Anapl_08047 [Anas platyrhynchos]|uniref:Uncharacterized protein n=1 Tax=Anas platyrhynchos TaxID=8839 RepID=R0LTK1_ANAPL|nr:hypothetical protein Anapl_08047 [Anas platyrhynchos]